MAETKEKSVGFFLANIETEQFAILEDLIADPSALRLNIDINFGIDPNKEMIGCFVEINYLLEKKKVGMKLATKCEFQIEQKAWNSFKGSSGKKLKINKGFLRHLAMISVGTTRGILHAETTQSDYNNYPLPTINVNEIIEKDQTFNL